METLEKKSIRDGFGEGLLEEARKNKDIVVLSADVTESTRMHWFKKEFPERFIEMGVAEQNMAGVAAGLALSGKIPVIASYAVFSPGRNWEQIRTEIAYNNLPVKIIGSHSGVVTGEDGFSHQALEDISLITVLPNMSVISPCDFYQAKSSMKFALNYKGPVYLRGVRPKTPIINGEKDRFVFGKLEIIRGNLENNSSKKIAIVTTGHLVYEAVLASEYFSREGFIELIVVNASTIKPFDKRGLVEIAKRVDGLIVAQDHQKIGGLNAIVAQILAENYPLVVGFIGVDNQFGQSGKPEELLSFYKLDKNAIIEKVKKLAKNV